MTLPDKVKALPLPDTKYVLAREARPYEPEYIFNEPGYAEEDMRALLDAAATLAAEHEARAKALADALERAQRFIRNGIELGFIRMPDPDTPDPAHDTPRIVDAALRAWKESQ